MALLGLTLFTLNQTYPTRNALNGRYSAIYKEYLHYVADVVYLVFGLALPGWIGSGFQWLHTRKPKARKVRIGWA